MVLEALTEQNISKYLAYLHKAMAAEPDMMPAEQVDEAGIRARLSDSFYQKTKSVLAMDGEEVIGRIEYHFYGCLQDGYRMAYVDWIYVLPNFRHRGVAGQLWKAFEKDCIANQINECCCIRTTNPEADAFYHSFRHAKLDLEPTFRKSMDTGEK